MMPHMLYGLIVLLRAPLPGEPDKPFLTDREIHFEENIAKIPFKQLDTGGSPISSYMVRYKAVSGLRFSQILYILYIYIHTYMHGH